MSEQTQQDDGGPAFPMTYSEDAAGNPAPVNKSPEDYGTYIHSSGGMSLRDWLAGQAIVGWAYVDVNAEAVSKAAYAIADAMLKARNAKE